jgi:hypothetical protein
MTNDAFWIPEGNDRFRATLHTQGPWSPSFQHGGPPAALLVRQIEHCAPREDMLLARISIDILGPVPIATLSATARIIRPGKSVELLEATLTHEERLVMRATAWRVKLPNQRPPADEPETMTGLPEQGNRPAQSSTDPSGFLAATEWRYIHGGYMEGRAAVWGRLRYPLIAGEDPSATQRLIAITDSANGISSRLDIRSWQFVPPELTIHCLRSLVGEWVGLDATTHVQAEGIGLTTANLFDEHGIVGRSAQALFIARRLEQ